jgi:antitoxin component YwqK of YwqJK toxin-antitoxin module
MGIFDIFKSEKEEKDYYPNGQLKSIVHLDRSGEFNGPVSFYNLEGNKIMEWNYNNGICNGKITTWYSNGNKSSEGEIKL